MRLHTAAAAADLQRSAARLAIDHRLQSPFPINPYADGDPRHIAYARAWSALDAVIKRRRLRDPEITDPALEHMNTSHRIARTLARCPGRRRSLKIWIGKARV